MKKIFSLILMTAASLAAHADFTLLFGDTPVKDGDKFSIGYEFIILSDSYGDDVITKWRYVQNPNLFITGDAGSTVTLTVKTNDQKVNVCSFDGLCESCQKSNSYTVTKTGKLTGGIDDLLIDNVTTKNPDVDPKLKEIVVDVTVKSGGKSVSCTVTMTTEPRQEAGIAGDVNADGEVNISDVQAVLNTMSGSSTEAGADVNADGEVNISDVQTVLNIMSGLE